ncbi:bifunctional D-glycero-beta-D-manno-heptose-7-phosphate kinase/D-glycero-beta-D-manno-heptose 1-phosphate adenylyltransferase HldE [Terriglobus roseus]|uniref:Bifunctional protein HldE n=1 Tax=Terriglobus roseus TaxID=392734 RepID=A0A1G7JPD1_9BACT|nr:bifunctional D-glycero-beta-D-manno-heptose-7-phosphate kinase/D-glycero-beta-D-manno-heptose 1-phosphate adenylyltransferase HldE [Terriglobus roseus]SDF26715.1 D-alpha,beta-D-heptose 7-phosphate 1-kinase /D-beta-D-heptose 1-phosphate adenylyltransferase [Terriglobus roseus]
MLPELHKVLDLLEGGFGSLGVLVVGDVMIDRYIVGDVERISPEAPVPVLRQVREYSRPGGAANVAMNLAGLGLKATLAGFVGDDAAGAELRSLLKDSGVDPSGLVDCGLPTIAKTRVVSRTQQLMRIDVESRNEHADGDCQALRAFATKAVSSVQAVILSDYAKGALTRSLCHAVIEAARSRGVPVLVDPKTRDFTKYSGATTISPNLNELSMATGVPPHQTDDLLQAGRDLLRSLEMDYLTVTMSEKGIRVLHADGKGEEIHSPSRAREVFDVSGAGDTVIATLAAGLAGGLQVGTAVDLANVAAGIVVAKLGTVPVAAHEIVAELTVSGGITSAEKVLDLDRAVARIDEWKESGETVVFTNGCFDLLHIGHVTLLEDCRRYGSKLVVAMNTDRSVSELKGPTRPIVGQNERTRVMAALGCVDMVVLFDEETPLELIRALKPNVLVKGGDYSVETVVGHEDVLAAGGRVEIVPTVEGFSTTNIVKKMTAGYAK